MSKTLPLLVLLLSMSAFAQTTYNWQGSLCHIQASNYLFCSDMNEVNVNGINYVISINVTVPNIYTYPASRTVAGGTITFQNAATDVYTTENIAGTYSDYAFALNFSGEFTGTLTFDFVRSYPKPPCGRWCWLPIYTANGDVLTLE